MIVFLFRGNENLIMIKMFVCWDVKQDCAFQIKRKNEFWMIVILGMSIYIYR